MANRKQIATIKKGVKAWNEWREKNPEIKIDLSGADLDVAELGGANLSGADLREATLRIAILTRADLRGADLREAILNRANLLGADLRAAILDRADLSRTRLVEANLSGADLSYAFLTRAHVRGANLSGARVGFTSFDEVDLSEVKGLGELVHIYPSSIGIDTIYKSKGKIPEVFLRGCGVPENFIEYMHSLTGKAFDFYSCFISHSAKDKSFCERLYADLQAKGVRTWYFPEDAKWGETVWGEIDRGIKIYDKLIVVLSENSLQSKPVLREIERSLVREDAEGKGVLFPIALDDFIFRKNEQGKDMWQHPRKVDILAKVVGDFSGWDEDAAKYAKALDKLLKGLQAGTGA